MSWPFLLDVSFSTALYRPNWPLANESLLCREFIISPLSYELGSLSFSCSPSPISENTLQSWWHRMFCLSWAIPGTCSYTWTLELEVFSAFTRCVWVCLKNSFLLRPITGLCRVNTGGGLAGRLREHQTEPFQGKCNDTELQREFLSLHCVNQVYFKDFT